MKSCLAGLHLKIQPSGEAKHSLYLCDQRTTYLH